MRRRRKDRLDPLTTRFLSLLIFWLRLQNLNVNRCLMLNDQSREQFARKIPANTGLNDLYMVWFCHVDSLPNS